MQASPRLVGYVDRLLGHQQLWRWRHLRRADTEPCSPIQPGLSSLNSSLLRNQWRKPQCAVSGGAALRSFAGISEGVRWQQHWKGRLRERRILGNGCQAAEVYWFLLGQGRLHWLLHCLTQVKPDRRCVRDVGDSFQVCCRRLDRACVRADA